MLLAGVKNIFPSARFPEKEGGKKNDEKQDTFPARGGATKANAIMLLYRYVNIIMI
jgi:hypothetical protein